MLKEALPLHLQVLDGSINLCYPSSNVVLVFSYYFCRWKQLSWLLIGLSHHNNPHSIGQGINMGLFQLLSVSVPIMHPGIGKICSEGIWGYTGPTVRWT